MNFDLKINFQSYKSFLNKLNKHLTLKLILFLKIMASKYWRQIFKVVTCSISLRKSLFVASGFGTIYQFKKSSNFANFSHLTFAASPNDIFLSKFQEVLKFFNFFFHKF